MGSINGAVASAEPDGPASSDSSHSTSESGGDSDNTPTPSARDDSPSASDDSGGSTGPDDEESGTSAGANEDTEPRSPVFAPSNDSDDTPPTDAPAPVADPVVAVPEPAAAGHGSDTTEVKTGTETVAPAPSSVAQQTAELTAPMAAALSGPQAAPEPAPAPAPIPDAAPTQGPPAPVSAIPKPTVVSVAAPGLGAAVAYLLSNLVATALDIVTAVIQMVTDFRATLGIPWAGQGGGDARVPSAFLPANSIVLVLERILSRSLSPKRGSSTLDNALAAGLRLGAALAFTSSLPAAMALTGSRDADGTHPTPVRGVVTALAAISLWALLSAALPGLSGLFAAAATGVRLGYRQARARMALHTMELTRYVRAGPIGVVRTGSSVSVHTRSVPAGRLPGSPPLKLVA